MPVREQETIDSAKPGVWGSPGEGLWSARIHVARIIRKTEQLRAAAMPNVDMPDSGIEVIADLRRELDGLERTFKGCLAARKYRAKEGYADVRCGFGEALRLAREAAERMARDAGWHF